MIKSNLPKNLEHQMDKFITAQMTRCMAHYNEPKLRQTIQANFEWIREFARLHYQSRIQRAEELTSPEVLEAQELSHQYIGAGNHDFFVTCVDGRNMPTVMFSKPPHIGGVLRAPAGTVSGFMEGQEPGTVFIDHESYVVQRIVMLLKEKAGDTIFYGLDSHLGCAARAQIHATEGGQQVDGGLRADILNKLMTARGILQLRSSLKDTGQEVAEIIPLFFSYDPTSGGVIAGLEMHIDEEDVAKTGYTKEILDKYVEQKRIVRTLDLLENPEVVRSLASALNPSSADFRKQYPSSLLANWKAIVRLYNAGKGMIYLKLLDMLNHAYSSSGWVIGSNDSIFRRSISERTLKQKAKFLLKNLVTRYSIAGTDKKWPYDSHQEEMTVITDGGYAPFPAIDAFAVFSRDLNALIPNTKLTLDLIRTFRRAGKLSNPVQKSSSKRIDFPSAPVLILNKGILRNIKKESWEALESLHLEKVFLNMKWDDSELLNWNKSDIQTLVMNAAQDKRIVVVLRDALEFVDGVYELFDRIRIMMKDKYFRQMILHGNILVLNTLVDQDRMPRFIVQFVI